MGMDSMVEGHTAHPHRLLYARMLLLKWAVSMQKKAYWKSFLLETIKNSETADNMRKSL